MELNEIINNISKTAKEVDKSISATTPLTADQCSDLAKKLNKELKSHSLSLTVEDVSSDGLFYLALRTTVLDQIVFKGIFNSTKDGSGAYSSPSMIKKALSTALSKPLFSDISKVASALNKIKGKVNVNGSPKSAIILKNKYR